MGPELPDDFLSIGEQTAWVGHKGKGRSKMESWLVGMRKVGSYGASRNWQLAKVGGLAAASRNGQ